MRYISIFSGIEAASCAWRILGFEPVAFAEIDKYASAVLAAHYPNVPNLGDVSSIDWSNYRENVDIVVGGSPCQSFSIAGNREGLNGASGLMWEYVRCIREVKPAWLVWENVPGALSSSRGKISDACSSPWLNSGIVCLGEYLTLNISEYPKHAEECMLSDILETTVPSRYFLTAKACQGILRRCEKVGRPLPLPMKEALEKQAHTPCTYTTEEATLAADEGQ